MLFKTLQWQQALALSERGASSSLTQTAGQQIIPNWVGGKDAALDVTIITPLQAVTMPGAANTAGHALNHAFGRKVNGAEEECRRQGVAFLPMVAETFGGWHSAAQREVKKLGAALARHTEQEDGEAISHLWSRMGILLQRGDAAILGNRVLSQPGPISTASSRL